MDLITRLVGAPATLMHVFVYIYVHVQVTFGVPDFYLKQGLSHFLVGVGRWGGVFLVLSSSCMRAPLARCQAVCSDQVCHQING